MRRRRFVFWALLVLVGVDVRGATADDNEDSARIKRQAIKRFKPLNMELPPLTRGRTGHVVGGKPATRSTCTFLAALFINNAWFCGGSMISKNYVVTAGHCVHLMSAVVVLLGATNITSDTETGRIIRLATNVTTHPKYDPNRVINDIALIKFPAVNFTAIIKPISLPDKNSAKEAYLNKNLTIFGWGKLSDKSDTISSTVQTVDLTAITIRQCSSYYSGINTALQLCTSVAGGAGTCSGDSGGPLVLMAGNATALIGVVSFGASGGCTTAPNVFTRLSGFLSFISSVMTGSP